jgi:ABC-type lipoprotein release transport system permease subunit
MMGTTAIVLRLAWRNLWRNQRRTWIMLGAIIVGVWAMIFMNALMRGMVDDMVKQGIEALPGHVQIHNPAFRDDPTVDNLMPAPADGLKAALDGDGVVAWASRVRVPAVVSSERDSRGITLIGIDPEAEKGISFLADDMTAGRYLEGIDDDGLIVGRRLLDKLETGLDKRVVVMTQNPDNDIVDRGFRIVGVYESDMASLEETLAFTGRAPLQDLLGIGDRVSEIAALGRGYRSVEPLYTSLADAAGPSLEVLPWYELDPYLGTMLKVMDGFVLVWIVVVFLALSFGLVNTLVMAVFERVREIGLMLALGMKPAVVLGQVVAESLMLLGIGLVAGNALAWASIQPITDGIDVSVVAQGLEMMGASSVLRPSLQVSDMLLSSVVVIVLGFLASLSPAWRASRYEPVEAITKV